MQWDDLPDAAVHYLRIYLISAALDQGYVYPRWLQDLYLGYGYPVLNFYAPATYYLGALLHHTGMTVYASLQWSGVAAVFTGALGTYFLAVELTGSRALALSAGGAYVLAPYPFNANLYVRGAVPEALALGVLPWSFLAVHHSWRGHRYWPAGLAGVFALLVLAHNVPALVGAPFLVAWALALRLVEPRAFVRPLIRTLAALTLGAALSAFFWFPALVEASRVQLEITTGGIYDYHFWLFDPLRAVTAREASQYPLTPVGPADLGIRYSYAALQQQLPLKPSLVQLVLWTVGAGAGSLALVRIRARQHRAEALLGSSDRFRAAGYAGVFAAFALACWFMNTTWSTWLWDLLPLLHRIQFPYRLYGPFALFVALAGVCGLAALLPQHTRASGIGGWFPPAAGFAMVGLLAYGSLALRPFAPQAEPAHDVDARTVLEEERNAYGSGTTSAGEFLPRHVDIAAYERGVRRGIRLYDEAYPQPGWQDGWLRVLSGHATALDFRWQPNRLQFVVEAEGPAAVAVHQLLFDGWRAFVDGHEVTLRPAPRDEARQASYGFIVLDVPKGRHTVDVVFGSTQARSIGLVLSAIGAALSTGWLIASWPPVALLALTITAGMLAAFGARTASLPQPLGDSARRVAVDVAEAARSGQALVAAPNGLASALLPPFVDVRYLQIDADSRRWLYMHPASEVSVPVRLPQHPYLQTALALDPQVWDAPAGDGVVFDVLVDAQDGQGLTTIFSRRLNPRARAEDRGWVEAWIDLAPFAGRNVRLTLRTSPGEDVQNDWAGWAEPHVLSWTNARPIPSTPHRW